MKCKRCGGKARVQLRHHNAAFCQPCFVFFFQRQVQRTIEHEHMFTLEDRILVAVSGGKDSLALWDVLATLGYQTTGLHLSLGIGDYSRDSAEKTKAFAEARGLALLTVDLEESALAIPVLARATRRPACATCGLSKRHHFDAVAAQNDFRVVATGHNLDDEAARLLGNVMRWQRGYLSKQKPVLEPNHPKFARKVRPLFRLTEYETAVYAFLRKIEYVVEECPNAEGASQLVYKDALNRIEAVMPGSKLGFVQEFLKSAQPLFEQEDLPPPETCSTCGMPSWGVTCSYCGLTARATATLSPQPTPSPDANPEGEETR